MVDGGGIRGLSELLILERIMVKLKTKNNLQHVPIPADVFDMIGGTSTGGYVTKVLSEGTILTLTAQVNCTVAGHARYTCCYSATRDAFEHLDLKIE
jgi:Patatin-like phospholipase